MGATAAVHPTDETLFSYGLGTLDLAATESIDKHLEDCGVCQRRAAAISSEDRLLDRLRHVHGEPGSTGPVVSSIAGLSMLDQGGTSRHRRQRTRCPRGWPTTRTTRSSASSARGAWGRSTWPRTGSWAGTKS